MRAKYTANVLAGCSSNENGLDFTIICTRFVMEYVQEVGTNEMIRRSIEACLDFEYFLNSLILVYSFYEK